jgi:hypothetical protein
MQLSILSEMKAAYWSSAEEGLLEDEVAFWADDVTFWADDVAFWADDVAFWADEVDWPIFLDTVIRPGTVELERQYKQGCELTLASPYRCHKEVKLSDSQVTVVCAKLGKFCQTSSLPLRTT